MDANKLKNFIKQFEGFSEKTYDDSLGNPTIGFGANKNSPSYTKALEELQAPDTDQMNRELASELFDKQMEHSNEYLNNIRKKDFPMHQNDFGKEAALQSLMMNAPNLVDERMRSNLNKNDSEQVIKQIILNSNPKDLGGLVKRRLEEAKMYDPVEYQKVIENLTDVEKTNLRDQWRNIKNINERQKVLEEYPFLDQVIMPRFGRIPQS